MGEKRKDVFLALGLFIVTVLACNLSTAKISDATLCKEVNEKKEPVKATTNFSATDKVIHCVVQLGSAPDDTKLRAEWFAKIKGEDSEKSLADTNITAGGSTNVVDFTLKSEGGFSAGDYRVDIYLNPDSGKKSEKPAKSLTFKVKGAAGDSTDSDSGSSSANGRIVKATLTSDSDGHDATTTFPVTQKTFYCQVTVKDGPPGLKVTAAWTQLTSSGRDINKEIDRAYFVVKEGSGNIVFNLTSAHEGFPPGDYRIELFLGESKTPAKSVTFSVYAEGN